MATASSLADVACACKLGEIDSIQEDINAISLDREDADAEIENDIDAVESVIGKTPETDSSTKTQEERRKEGLSRMESLNVPNEAARRRSWFSFTSPSLTLVVARYPSTRPPSITAKRQYPDDFKVPNIEMDASINNRGPVYDRDFLLQFMSVCKEKPDNLPPLEAIGLEPTDQTNSMHRTGSGRRGVTGAPPSSASRQGSVGLGLGPMSAFAGKGPGFPAMGNFASPNKQSGRERFNYRSLKRSLASPMDGQDGMPHSLSKSKGLHFPNAFGQPSEIKGTSRNMTLFKSPWLKGPPSSNSPTASNSRPQSPAPSQQGQPQRHPSHSRRSSQLTGVDGGVTIARNGNVSAAKSRSLLSFGNVNGGRFTAASSATPSTRPKFDVKALFQS